MRRLPALVLAAAAALLVPELVAAVLPPTGAVDSRGDSKKRIRAPYFIGTLDPAGPTTVWNAPISTPYSVTGRNLVLTDPASISSILGTLMLGGRVSGPDLGGTYDVRWLGASPSASAAANTVAINAALVAGAGSTVVIPGPGTYQVDGELVVTSATHLVIGKGATLRQTAKNTKLISVRSSSDVVIDGGGTLQCYGVGDSSSTYLNQMYVAPTGYGDATVKSCADGRGVDIYGSSRVTVRDLRVSGCRHSGILFRVSSDVTVEDNTVTGTYPGDVPNLSPEAGCHVDSGVPPGDGTWSQFGIQGNTDGAPGAWNYPTTQNVTVRGNRISGTLFGIFDVPRVNSTWELNQITGVGQHCAYMYPGINLKIVNNQCDRPYNSAWKVQGMVDQYAFPPSGITIDGNQASNGVLPGNAAVLVTFLDTTNGGADGGGNSTGAVYRGVSVRNNTIQRWPGIGVRVDHAEAAVQANTITDALGFGVFVNAVTGVVSENLITRCAREPVYALPQIGSTLRIANNQIASGAEPPAPWQPSRAYLAGDMVANAAHWYIAIVAGTSAGAGGPTTNALNITDGTVVWNYMVDEQAPYGYVLASAAYDPPLWTATQWYGEGSVLRIGTGFYRAMWDGVSATTVAPTADPAYVNTDGTTAWRYIGNTSSLRGTVIAERNTVVQGPRDNVTSSATASSTGAAGNFAYATTGNLWPYWAPDGVTTLYASYTASLLYTGDELGGHGMTLGVAHGAGARGRVGRDFIVHDAAGLGALRGFHNLGDRAWQDQPAGGTLRPVYWVCASSGAPCPQWKPVYLGAPGGNSDLAGIVTASGNTYTLNFSQTFAFAPVCVCSNQATGGTCNVQGVGTASVTFRTNGATDSLVYNCTPRN